eukprot:4517668-Prorocentrum_lima.AAC.1
MLTDELRFFKVSKAKLNTQDKCGLAYPSKTCTRMGGGSTVLLIGLHCRKKVNYTLLMTTL